MRKIIFALSCLLTSLVSTQLSFALSDIEKSHLRRVNVYFNTIGNMEGDFIQIDPQGRESSGKFYLSRPGKIRFQYNLPSPSAVLSNGTFVAYQDAAGNNKNRYPLATTPLKFLLREKVDLLKDTAIQQVNASQEVLTVAMASKVPTTPGSLTLNFALPNYELVGWSVVDGKGLTTRIIIGNLAFNNQYDDNLFFIPKHLGKNRN